MAYAPLVHNEILSVISVYQGQSSHRCLIVQLLEARNLIILNPILSGEDATLNHSVLTAIVHLRRFAPRLEPGQVFKVISGMSSSRALGAMASAYLNVTVCEYAACSGLGQAQGDA